MCSKASSFLFLPQRRPFCLTLLFMPDLKSAFKAIEAAMVKQLSNLKQSGRFITAASSALKMYTKSDIDDSVRACMPRAHHVLLLVNIYHGSANHYTT